MSHSAAHPEFMVLGPRDELLRCVDVPRGLTAKEAVEVIVAQHDPRLVNGAFPVYLMARADNYGGWSLPGQDEPFDALEPSATQLRLRQDRDPLRARHLDWIEIATILRLGMTNDVARNSAYGLLKHALTTAKSEIEQRQRDRKSHLSEEAAIDIATSCACLRLGIDDPARLRPHHTNVTRHWQRVRLESWRVPLSDRQEHPSSVIVQLEVLPDRLEGSEVLVQPNYR